MPYPQMLYGAALSGVLATVLVALLGRCRTPTILLTSALAAFVMPMAWNLILRTTGATESFSHDLPFTPLPDQLAGHRKRRVHPRRSDSRAGRQRRGPHPAACRRPLTADRLGGPPRRHLHLLTTP